MLLLRFLSDELNGVWNSCAVGTLVTLINMLPARDRLPPLNETILANAVDFPAIEEPRTHESPQSTTVKVQDDKQVNNKLARFLKLHPKP